ncbi:MAG: TlpA family protein disulfide reductase, partial [Chloroflexota bacterium]|nr:TlpA family protein disulfide reductase [Chloroflexota bacterium]
MSGWQRFYEENRGKNFELVAVAIETQGAEMAQPWVERAGATYTAAVDQHGLLARHLDFKAVPNGVFLDEQGTIRYAKYGGFSVSKDEDREAIQKLIDGNAVEQGERRSEA